MTVLLVLATFVVFLLLDYFYSREPAVQREEKPAPALRLRPAFVCGFVVPENLSYHPGHTWALQESPELVRVGLDDFAARLLGKVKPTKAPERGQWVRQGQPVFAFTRDGQGTQLVSPIEGMVTEINAAAFAEQELACGDPYGSGWLMKVQSPDARMNFRNLLSGDVARKWMEEAATRLMARLPALAGAVAQDGGPAISDIADQLPDQDWEKLTGEFFLT
jgi:glycine cleavage system H lipoate-binding protein